MTRAVAIIQTYSAITSFFVSSWPSFECLTANKVRAVAAAASSRLPVPAAPTPHLKPLPLPRAL